MTFASALVTGASSGIGEAMVRRLVAGGARVVAVARREDRLHDLADELGSVDVLVADLSTSDGVEAVRGQILDLPDLDLVVNNAGFGTYGSFADLDAARLADEVALNVHALTQLSHAALGVMLPRGRGHLLNVSSIAAFQPVPDLAVYAATKAYVLRLSEALHEEVRGTGVHVSALCPGWTRTEFQAVSGSYRHVAKVPRIAWSSPDAVAAAGLCGVAAGRAVVSPGAAGRVLSAVSGVTPRPLARWLAGRVQRS